MADKNADLKQTPLYNLHLELGAKMVPFAGYEMPVQYKLGVMKEHLHTRAKAGLFDVSHMGQVIIRGDQSDALEKLIPQNVKELKEGRQRYGYFTNEKGGILDDLMFANKGDHIFMVVNAACKDQDIAHMRAHDIELEVIDDRALIALQGPQAEDVLATLCPEVKAMKFMDVLDAEIMGQTAWISRSGYTGEDGFEISYPAKEAENLTRKLLENEALEPIGLGARDSLRLEAGLCLYGHDIDETTSPVEAALVWGMQKRRREEGGFLGDKIIQDQLQDGTSRLRVGLSPEGRAPMREGTELFNAESGGERIGVITSGGFGPSVNAPVAMGYVESEYSKIDTQIWGELRGKRLPVKTAELPFIPANFKR